MLKKNTPTAKHILLQPCPLMLACTQCIYVAENYVQTGGVVVAVIIGVTVI